MTSRFDSVEAAFMALADPRSPDWADAFSFLSGHPRTARMMVETFRETLEQMGVEPTDTDPVSGEPSFSLADVARAMGVAEEDLEVSVAQAKRERGN
ncbi:MAG: hypothetical protein PVF91_08095 [Chromatiales bacterium]|jgi:hypothetical protein